MDEILANPRTERAAVELRNIAARSPSAGAVLLEQLAEEHGEADPTRASRWLTEAAALWSDGVGDARRAARALRAALDICPTDEDALLQLTQLYRQNGKHRALVRLLERRAEVFLEERDTNPQAKERAAEAFTALGHLLRDPPIESPTEAVAAYSRAIGTGAAPREAFRAARDLYLEAEQDADALPLFALERETCTEPEEIIALYREEAVARRLVGDVLGATAALVAAQKVDPDAPALAEDLWQALQDRSDAGETLPEEDLAKARAALEHVAAKIERDALAAEDLAALKLAFGLHVRPLSGVSRAMELVRQAEVLVGLGGERPLALRHVEPGIAALDAKDAKDAIARLTTLTGLDQMLELHERLIARATTDADRVRAVEVAGLTAVRASAERLEAFFGAAVGTVVASPASLTALEKIARDGDTTRRDTRGRAAFVAALVKADPPSRDGGRARSALLRRAALIARRDLKDPDQAFEWMSEAVFVRLDGALEALEASVDAGARPVSAPRVPSAPAIPVQSIPPPPAVPPAAPRVPSRAKLPPPPSSPTATPTPLPAKPVIPAAASAPPADTPKTAASSNAAPTAPATGPVKLRGPSQPPFVPPTPPVPQRPKSMPAINVPPVATQARPPSAPPPPPAAPLTVAAVAPVAPAAAVAPIAAVAAPLPASAVSAVSAVPPAPTVPKHLRTASIEVDLDGISELTTGDLLPRRDEDEVQASRPAAPTIKASIAPAAPPATAAREPIAPLPPPVPRPRPSASSRRRISRSSVTSSVPKAPPSVPELSSDDLVWAEPGDVGASGAVGATRRTPTPSPVLAVPMPSIAPKGDRRNSMRASGDDLIADLFEATHELDFCRSSSEAAAFALRLAMDKLVSDAGVVHLYDIDRREFVIAQTAGAASSVMLGLRTSEDDPLAAEALRTRGSVIVSDPGTDPRLSGARWKELRRSLGAPLTAVACARCAESGRFLGLIELGNRGEDGAFEAGDEHALTYIAERLTEFFSAHGVTLDEG